MLTIARAVRLLSLFGSTAALVALVVVVAGSTTLRSLNGRGIHGAAEVAGYLLVSIGALGMAYCISEDGFLRIDIVVNRLRQRWVYLVNAACYALGLTAFGYWAYSSWFMAINSWENQILSIGPLRIPVAYPQSILALGLSILCIQLALGLWEYTVRFATYSSAAQARSDKIPPIAGVES